MNRVEVTVKAVIGVVGLTAGIASAQMKPILTSPAQQQQQDQIAPAIACFAPGSDPRYVAAVNGIVNHLNAERLGTDYQLGGRWSGALGTARALTWSFVPDGILLGSGAGEPNTVSVLFAKMDAAFASQGGRATWINRYTQIFARWQALSGVSYTRITVGGNDWDDGAAFPASAGSATRGDCRCGGHSIDGASGSNVLAYCYFPSTGDSVLDTDNSANFASSSGAHIFLRNTVGHEFGHGLGLQHVDPTNGTKLMEAFISTAYDGPQQDDIRAIQRQYGDPYEPNDAIASAKPLGAVVQGTPLAFGNTPAAPSGLTPSNSSVLSIDGDAKVDYWSFSVNQPVLLTATATPVGTTYLQGPQGGATANDNALAQGNLAVDVIASNGTTVLASATSAAIGTPEVASSVSLPGAGTYYLKVYETNTPTESQLYKMSVSVTNAAIVCPSFTTQPAPLTNVCEGGNVTLTVAVSGDPAPSLQWKRNGADIFGETGTSFTLLLINAGSGAGTYTCVATAPGCSSVTSNNAVIHVNTHIAIETEPEPQTVTAGSPVSFFVGATSNPAPTYQWRKNFVDIGGATGSTYTIPSTVTDDAGLYDCVVTNVCDEQSTEPVQLTVNAGASCYANCDQSTSSPVLNANDFNCFLNAFASGQSYANCDESTTVPVLNANDFNCFLNAFAAGCT